MSKMQEHVKNTYLFWIVFGFLEKTSCSSKKSKNNPKTIQRKDQKLDGNPKNPKFSLFGEKISRTLDSWTPGPQGSHMPNLGPFPGTRAKPFQKCSVGLVWANPGGGYLGMENIENARKRQKHVSFFGTFLELWKKHRAISMFLRNVWNGTMFFPEFPKSSQTDTCFLRFLAFSTFSIPSTPPQD